MMPLPPSFRRLLLAKIPKLKREDLNKYDSLLALRYQAVHQKSLDLERRKDFEEFIRKATQQANAIIAPFRTQFDKLQQLWATRRISALYQGDILQVPTTLPVLRGLVTANFKHSWVQFTAFGRTLRLQMRSLTRARVFAIIVLAGTILYGISSLPTGNPDHKPTKPQPQEGRQIRP